MGDADGGVGRPVAKALISSGFRSEYEIDADFSWTGMGWHLSVCKRERVGLLLRSPFVACLLFDLAELRDGGGSIFFALPAT